VPVETRGIDHVIILSRDLDRAEDTYRRLGFCLAPRMFHPMGTANNLLMFKTNFLELLGIVAPEKLGGPVAAVRTFLDAREGASHIVFLSTDVQADHAEFTAKSLAPKEVFGFRRAVTLPDGRETTAVVNTVTLPQPQMPLVSLFVCQQHVPEAIWVPQWQQQPNGVEKIVGVTLVADDRSALRTLYSKLFGPAAITEQDTALVVQTPNGRLEVLTTTGLEQRYGWAGIQAEATRPYIAGVTLKVGDLAVLERILRENTVPYHEATSGIVVSPDVACGVILEFTN
jgi:catechol 2,3-dioxygenase-like lactoylglutathione lyase family enzyme